MDLETARSCVILNATYEPLDVIPMRRALMLVIEGKATAVEEHPYLVIRSVRESFKLPTMVLLKQYVKSRRLFRSKAPLNAKNLFARDDRTCQYCGRHEAELKNHEELTRDHIYPRHLGGKDSWENLVTACSTCNNKKANHLLENTGMKLLKMPVVPSQLELWMKNTQRRASLEKLETL